MATTKRRQGTMARIGKQVRSAAKTVTKKTAKALKPVGTALGMKGKKTSSRSRKRTTKSKSR